MAGIAIRSAGELFAFMALAGDDETLWDALDLDRFHLVVPVSIRGALRDGRIDAAGAKFVRDLQKQTNDAFRIYGGVSTGGRKNWLRVAVDNGSDKFSIDFTEIGKEGVRKMTPQQIMRTFFFCAILATGYFAFDSYNDADVERVKAQIAAHVQEQQSLHEERAQERQLLHEERLLQIFATSNSQALEAGREIAADVAEEAASQGRDAYRPVRRLVNSMRRGETLKAGDGQEFTKRQALEKLGTLPDTEVMFYVHGDGSYSLLGIDLHEGAQGLRIAQDEEKTTAILERLSPDLQASIVAKVRESIARQAIVNLDLQIDVYFTLSGIHHAVVVGVGRPRGGLTHYGFADIPNEVRAGDLMRQGERDDSPSPSM